MELNLKEEFKHFAFDAPVVESVGMNTKVLIVDGLNLFIRCFSMASDMNDEGELVGGITGSFRSLGAAIRKIRPTRVIIAFDGAGGSKRRRAIFKDYKENRKTRSKLNRTYDFKTLDEEKDSMKRQLMLFVQLLRFFPVTVLAPDNVEADDVISYLAELITRDGGESIIMSTDKDFLQLVDSAIRVYNPIKNKLYFPEYVTEEYGIHPNNFLMYRAITGDSSDNVPGIEGFKEKTLLKHFPEVALEEKVSMNQMIEKAQLVCETVKKPPVVMKRFAESRDVFKMNIQLMDLRNMQMGWDSKSMVEHTYHQSPPPLNRFELTKHLVQYKFIRLFANLDSWLTDSFLALTRYSRKDV